MAQPPQDLPESIVLGQFAGIRNTVARTRLGPSELEAAVNVDVDDVGQVRRRRGYNLVDAGSYHSVARAGGRVLAARDGTLGWVDDGYSFHSLGLAVGIAPLAYVDVGDTTYIASESVSAKLIGDTISDWGDGSTGEWVSPVMTPTDTLGEVFGYEITAPPRATTLGWYSGRIYLGAGRYLWATELWLYDYVQKTRNFLQFEDDITMIAPVSDGIFVGTVGHLWFLKGTMSEGLQRLGVLDYGVIPGSQVPIPATSIHPSARSQPMAEDMGWAFMTQRGMSAGFNGGDVFDITQGRVVFPGARSAAALYREDSGVNSYVAVTDSAGGPAANARIGDYVDAEIVRRL